MDIFSDFFGDIWHNFDVVSYGVEPKAEPRCPVCSHALSDFSKSGRLGCSECYEAFRPLVERTLKKIHLTNSHEGKIPSKAGKELRAKKYLENLKNQLQEAVKKEDYELAAKIHREIKQLEQD